MGNNQHNQITGGAGNDVLKGGNGDDVLSGGAGNDTVDGGNDSDTVVLGGNRADYFFSRPDVGKTQVARKDGTETDILIAVEQVKFADGSLGQLTLDDLLKNTASKFSDNYEGDKDANVFDGLAGNDSILGGGGNDSLAGGLGNDTLDGGAGSDQLSGGMGNDLYIADTAAVADPDPAKAVNGDVISEAPNAGLDKVQTSLTAYTLGAHLEHLDYLGTPVSVLDAAGKPTGATHVQQLAFAGTGNELANTITGNTGNDTLDGGKGADRLIGGAGDDSYLIDNPGDRTIEKDATGVDSGGTDTIQTSLATYSLAGNANVENLSYSEANAFRGTGNALDNLISGGAANDVMAGGDGSDTLLGKDGSDLLRGGNGDDVLNGGAGNDTLDGGNDPDTAVLDGNRADYVFSRPDVGKVQIARKDGSETDLLTSIEQVKFADGTTGQVTLDDLLKNTASKFDDNYEGDKDANVFDGLAGNDSILGGGGNDSLAGGLGNDTLDGDSGDDTLIGGKGDDVYVVESLGDVVTETALEGTDTVRTALASLTLAAQVERLVYVGTDNFSGSGNELNNLVTGGGGSDSLSGGLGADLLQGGDGKDTLDGGDGTDRLEGGAGDDTYIVTSPADLVRETDAGGNDTGGIDTLRTQAAGRYVLALNVENFAVDATDGVVASGNAGNNLIRGNSGNDTLAGGAGNDTLNGGAGADRLSGGLDSDVFVFDTAPASGIDTISDFRSGEDKIEVDHAIFDKLGAAGALNAEFFVEGKAALDANDFLVYDKATGMLWYDADGSGAGAALELTLLANKAVLAATDFSVA